MNRADEKWVELTRQQKYRGVPLQMRTAGNEAAARQTDALLPKYTAEKFSLWRDDRKLPGVNQCQRCGRELVSDRSRKKLIRKVFLADGDSISFYIGSCCLS